jgi:hypothetical protein
VEGNIEPEPVTLLTQNISKAGVCFPAPRRIEPGEFIESGNEPGWYKLAAALNEPPTGDGPGWHRLAAEFEKHLLQTLMPQSGDALGKTSAFIVIITAVRGKLREMDVIG